MWELSGWQSEHFLISSYGLKTTSRRPKLHFWLFWKERVFFYFWFWLFWLFFLNLLKSRYPFLDLPTPFWIFLPFFWIFLPLFGSSYPFLRKGGKSRKSIFWDEEFFRMSSYTFENFQLFILYNFQFDHVVSVRLPTALHPIIDFLPSKKQENQIWGTRSSSGWVLIFVRTFNYSFSTTFNFIMWS